MEDLKDFFDISEMKNEMEKIAKNEKYLQIEQYIRKQYSDLRQYQVEAISMFIYNDDFGIINLFCGLGKSIIS